MSIGEVLATARTESGLTVEDVSRETRIRGGLIRAIENDDFGPCGGAVYARGHIRNIAAVVGVDGQVLVAEFDRQHGSPQPSENPVPAFDPEVAAHTDRRRPNWAAAMAVALVAICLVAAVQLVTHTGSRDGDPGPADLAGPLVTSSPSGQPSPEVSRSPGDAVAALPRDGVQVRVRLVGSKSWLHVTGSDGDVLFEGLLRRGAFRDFADDRRVRMTVGNAGAVALIVNGRDVGVAGSDGEVSHLSFGPNSEADGAA